MHLGEGGDGVAEVLQHLVGVDDVERAGSGLDAVGVPAGERDVGGAGFVGRPDGLGDDLVGGVDADDFAGRDLGGEIEGDRARPAADVE